MLTFLFNLATTINLKMAKKKDLPAKNRHEFLATTAACKSICIVNKKKSHEMVV